MSRSKAVRTGFTAIFRDPAIFAAELAWRWTFSVAAVLLLIYALLMFLQSLAVSDSDYFGLVGFIPGTAASALANIFHGSGPKLIRVGLALWFGLTFLWWLAASAGRSVTLKAIMPGVDVRFQDMLRINALRAGLSAMAGLAYVGAIAAATTFSQRPVGRDPESFYLISIPLVMLVSIVWSTLAWYLSIAPIVAAQRHTGALDSLFEAAALTRRQPAQFTWVSMFYGFLRYAMATIGFFVLIAMAGATASLPEGSGWAVLVLWAAALSFVLTLIGTARLAATVRIVQWDAA